MGDFGKHRIHWMKLDKNKGSTHIIPRGEDLVFGRDWENMRIAQHTCSDLILLNVWVCFSCRLVLFASKGYLLLKISYVPWSYKKNT
jgi:hypothetical protein